MNAKTNPLLLSGLLLAASATAAFSNVNLNSISFINLDPPAKEVSIKESSSSSQDYISIPDRYVITSQIGYRSKGSLAVLGNSCDQVMRNKARSERLVRLHKGVDYATPIGTSLVAPLSGRAEVAFDPGYGHLLIIHHGGGLETWFAHLNKIYVANGGFLARGQVVAETGNSGIGTGAHLHQEVRFNGELLHPETIRLKGLEYAKANPIGKADLSCSANTSYIAGLTNNPTSLTRSTKPQKKASGLASSAPSFDFEIYAPSRPVTKPTSINFIQARPNTNTPTSPISPAPQSNPTPPSPSNLDIPQDYRTWFDNSPKTGVIFRLVGAAEGNVSPTGEITEHYFGHPDPCLAVNPNCRRGWNFGFASTDKAGTKWSKTNDQAYLNKANLIELGHIRKNTEEILSAAKAYKLKLTPLELANAIDVYNQAPLALWGDSRGKGFLSHLRDAYKKGLPLRERIFYARVQSYYTNDGRSGFSLGEAALRPDQRRRMEEVDNVFEAMNLSTTNWTPSALVALGQTEARTPQVSDQEREDSKRYMNIEIFQLK